MLSFVLATFLFCSLSSALLGSPALFFLPPRRAEVDCPDHLVGSSGLVPSLWQLS
jgi:hypothetical protein